MYSIHCWKSLDKWLNKMHSTNNKVKLLDMVGIMLHISDTLCRMHPDKKYGDE